MASCCIICFKVEGRNNKSLNNVELQRKYLKFVQRYLSGGGGGDDGSGYQLTNFLFEQALNSGMVCCGKCHERMEAFCDLYNQLKMIELRLNWEVERLKNSLAFGGEVGAVKGLNVDMNCWSNEDEMLEMVRDLRKSIIDKCNRKLNRSFPKVAVLRGGLEEVTSSVAIDQPGINVNDDDQVFYEPNYEEVLSPACSEPIDGLQPDLDQELLEAAQDIFQENSRNEPKNLPIGEFSHEKEGHEDRDNKHVPISLEGTLSRSLRRVNKCDKCLRTFSTPEKLLDHQKEQHSQEIADESNDNESLVGNANDLTDSDSDYLHSPEPEACDVDEEIHEDGMEDITEIDIKPAIKKSISQCKTKGPTGKHCRFKCPGCLNLYKLLHELLLHHNKTHQNLNLSSETLLVEIIWIPSQILPHKKAISSVLNSEDFAQDTLHHYARIEAPTKIYFCQDKSCKDQPIYSEQALQEHANLHGQFPCNFCSVTKQFAPDLALHEITKHGKKKAKKGYNCPRCDYRHKDDKQRVINHYLTVHLSLPPFYTQRTCAICTRTLTWRLFEHYKQQHSTNHNNKGRAPVRCSLCNEMIPARLRQIHRRSKHLDDSRLIPCSNEKCRFIFETKEELRAHMLRHHRKIALKRRHQCPKCPQGFLSARGLHLHLRRHYEKGADMKPVIKKEISKKHFGFKCPSCPSLYAQLHELLLHHKNTHENPDQAFETLRVDIFWIPFNLVPFNITDRSVLNSEDYPDSLHHTATIETPTQVYFCIHETCKEQPIYSERALQIHAKLHGKFKCNYCPVTKEFAPDLSQHEITQHNNDTSKQGHCPRCDYATQFRSSKGLINHHLASHLHLPSFYTLGTCIICSVKGSPNLFQRPDKLIEHFQRLHNISKQTDDQQVAEACNQDEMVQASTAKYFSFKCPNCPNLYRMRHPFQTIEYGDMVGASFN